MCSGQEPQSGTAVLAPPSGEQLRREALCTRFVAFAAGSLGAALPAEAGELLELRDPAGESELEAVLRRIERVAELRALELADIRPLSPGDDRATGGAVEHLSAPFEAAMREACGAASGELFARLPHDGGGLVDLRALFGMPPAAPGGGAPAPDAGASIVDLGLERTQEHGAEPDPQLGVDAQSDALAAADGTPFGEGAPPPAEARAASSDDRGAAHASQVFTLSPDRGGAPPTSASPAHDCAGLPRHFPPCYVERPADLPQVAAGDVAAAEEHLAEARSANATWQSDVVALNVIRAAIAQQSAPPEACEGAAAAPPAAPPAASMKLITAVARLCKSRRSPLAMSSLRVMAELAEHAAGSPSESPWPMALDTAIVGCLGALRFAKLATRMVGTALATVTYRAAVDASPAAALGALAQCAAGAVRSRPPQPLQVAAGLLALAQLLPKLEALPALHSGPDGAALGGAAAQISKTCNEVLQSCMLAPQHPDARGVLRALQELGAAGGTCCSGTPGDARKSGVLAAL